MLVENAQRKYWTVPGKKQKVGQSKSVQKNQFSLRLIGKTGEQL